MAQCDGNYRSNTSAIGVVFAENHPFNFSGIVHEKDYLNCELRAILEAIRALRKLGANNMCLYFDCKPTIEVCRRIIARIEIPSRKAPTRTASSSLVQLLDTQFSKVDVKVTWERGNSQENVELAFGNSSKNNIQGE